VVWEETPPLEGKRGLDKERTRIGFIVGWFPDLYEKGRGTKLRGKLGNVFLGSKLIMWGKEEIPEA